MDFSVILVLPFSALVAFVMTVGVVLAKRPRPRLIWSWAISVLLTAPVFVGLPSASDLSFWTFSFFGLAIWAAIGAVVGGLVARLAIAAARLLRSD